ncbi:MAG: amino acid ABC transporter permease [Deinococcus sp.]|nr:amino acid ABC transporter permease [Deinococcus sp.]
MLLVEFWNFLSDPSTAQAFWRGSWITFYLTGVSGFLGLFMGLVAALAKISRLPLPRWLATFYIWFMRGTPLLVQIFLVAFGWPGLPLSFGLRLSDLSPFWRGVFKIEPFNAAVIALSFNVGAYNAEVIRAGILSVARGQVEAARSLGMSPLQAMRYVILPQAVPVMVPPLGNNLIALLKDSSLASVISVFELAKNTQILNTQTFRVFWGWLIAATLYLIMTSILEQGLNHLERRSSAYRNPQAAAVASAGRRTVPMTQPRRQP